MVKIIDASKDLEIMNYLKEHTYVQTQEHFSIAAQQIARVKKRNIQPIVEQHEEPIIPQPIPQPKPELPAVGSRTAAVDEISEPVEIPQKKKRIDKSRFERILKCKSYAEDKNLYWEKQHLIAFFEAFLQQHDPKIKISF